MSNCDLCVIKKIYLHRRSRTFSCPKCVENQNLSLNVQFESSSIVHALKMDLVITNTLPSGFLGHSLRPI